jgi:2-polyprenyl-3-methyl-5-hydroxy-6-metoxy-1,4-benzoquinol methylase
MTNEEIIQKINSFPRWHYEFNLRGNLTPVFDKRLVYTHAYRKAYFLDPVIHFFGGSLKGKRVLDLGCNAGFWSLLCAQSGCDFILGIDGRKLHVEQAQFVFEVNGIEKSRYQFIQKNIFELKIEDLGQFDIVLCLGLMYHISKPMTLLENISCVNTDLMIIDTTLSQVGGSFFEVSHEDLEEPRNAIDYELVLLPTKLAVVESAKQFGYDTLILKPPVVSLEKDYESAMNYKRGARRAFICAKKSDLSSFPAPIEDISPLKKKAPFQEIKKTIKKLVKR